ncbi:T9SS type A sorting domain-containing protein [Kaistella jeonii]|uniref:Secretion system C-terminal sorting domain-containing protein n=1 Tax=Kaistella jeonii TaxID=266749 RepID=A0A0C1FN57_9FLAO|nr:T9SS type A sorting domain-containing protein [Kaistella jeonii]KIA89374.1 hypothetical protein OA86_07215 [Kaistella jeonii]SFC04042.1 Por secretion system C-terminal sorting domain-containing protein [Kaistella jeonii]VEI96699.1 Uncharacterized protein related to plant photosystem II stability/assembly factor [Kaistella jeonii]
MKKTLLTLIFLLFLQFAFGQVSFVGNPTYGQLRNFVYDQNVPNRVYATTYIDKNIMVSNDNGVTWSVFYTLPYPAYSPSISKMHLTKNNTALSFIQYFGIGSPANKVVVLDLQSRTTLKEYSVPPNLNISGIANYNIKDDGTFNVATMFANGDSDQFFYTTNGGATWTKVYDGANDANVKINDAVMDPTNDQKLFVVRNGGPGNIDGGLLISNDRGATWTEKLNGLILQSIAINPQNSDIIYVGTGVRFINPEQHQAVYKSIDGGVTWAEVTGITWSTGQGALLNVPNIEINPNNPNHIIVLGDERVAVSVNAGATWTTTMANGSVDGDSYFYGFNAAFNPFDSNQVFLGNNSFPKFSSDKGVTLVSVANPYFNAQGKVTVINDGGTDQLLYGVQYGYSKKNLSDNTDTPISVLPRNETPGNVQIPITYFDKNLPGRTYFQASGFGGGNINVSNDYGATSFSIYSTFDIGFTVAETDPSNSNIVWFSTTNGETATLFRSNFADPDNPINDEISLPTGSGSLVSGLKINPDNSNEILLAVENRLFKTINGGTSWSEITAGLQDLAGNNYIFDMVRNPLNVNQYALSTNLGIFSSQDAGNTWTKIYSGFITKVDFSTKQNGQIVAFTNTYFDAPPQVIYSSNGGTTWNQKTTSDYFNSIIIDGTARFINDTTAEVYLATYSLGIIKDVLNFTTLGTESNNVKNDIFIYPNPVQDVLNFKFKTDKTQFKVSVYSVAGQLVASDQNKTSINLSKLTPGVYMVKIDSENESSIIKKIIKK